MVKSEARWLSSNASKRWGEKYFLVWSIGWLVIFGSVVAFKMYEDWADTGYLVIGLIVSVPYVLGPIVLGPSPADKALHWSQRYWVKANIWIAIFSYVGNYFWTHYFYKVLGASYSFPISIQLNQVPFALYLITHAYFCMYHTLTTMLIRRIRTSPFYSHAVVPLRTVGIFIFNAALIFIMGVVTAFMETWTISSVPYYSHQSEFHMYTVGSVFYGIYFFVSFPMFYRLDEKSDSHWPLSRALIDSLAASMIVSIFLDIWRLLVCAYLPSSVADLSVCSSLPVLIH